jgi:hypothetical protein
MIRFSWPRPASRAVSVLGVACVAGNARNTHKTQNYMSAAGASSHITHRLCSKNCSFCEKNEGNLVFSHRSLPKRLACDPRTRATRTGYAALCFAIRSASWAAATSPFIQRAPKSPTSPAITSAGVQVISIANARSCPAMFCAK